VLTIKVKNQLPEWRTALAIPVGQKEPPADHRSWLVMKPGEYDSATAKRLTGAWGKWISARAPGMQLYDLRHAWAIRSIMRNINPSLAAKCMGHSLAVHHSTYHRELSQRDVAAVAAQLSRN
jgi:integrase